MGMGILPAYMFVYYMHAWYPRKPGVSIGFPGTAEHIVLSCHVAAGN